HTCVHHLSVYACRVIIHSIVFISNQNQPYVSAAGGGVSKLPLSATTVCIFARNSPMN
ncbi:unnamed protein product, partial [Pylaiella littoralis]